jgi:hypothetical protein
MKRSLNGGSRVHPLSDHAKEVLRKAKEGPIPAYQINPGVRDVLTRKGYARIDRGILGNQFVNCLFWVSDNPPPVGNTKPGTDLTTNLSEELETRIATELCQYGRITRDMPSEAEIRRALPYARSLISVVREHDTTAGTAQQRTTLSTTSRSPSA